MANDKVKPNEQNIQALLSVKLLSNPERIVENLYVFDWESDLLLKTNSGYWYECEIKISVSDFKHDSVKANKHGILRTGHTVRKHSKWVNDEYKTFEELVPRKRPNRFYYAVPEEMVDKVAELVPEYAGLIAVDVVPKYPGSLGGMRIVKKAPLIHDVKMTDEELNLCEKFYYNWRKEVQWRRKHSHTIDELRYQIRSLKAEFKAVTGFDVSESL